MLATVAEFAHELQKTSDKGGKLSEGDLNEFIQLLEQRDEAWNKKAAVIGCREKLALSCNRATTAHKCGEPEAEKLWAKHEQHKEHLKQAEKACTSARDEFSHFWKEAEKNNKKTVFKSFMKQVQAFEENALEVFPFKTPEEKEDESDKTFNSAYSSFMLLVD